MVNDLFQTILAFGALAVVCAIPQQPQEQAQAPVEIVKQDSEVDVNGYNFEWVLWSEILLCGRSFHAVFGDDIQLSSHADRLINILIYKCSILTSTMLGYDTMWVGLNESSLVPNRRTCLLV